MKKLFHIHAYEPILSQYKSFCTRNIIYECKCGKRKLVEVYRPVDRSFPIPTSHCTDKEMQEVLKNGLKDKLTWKNQFSVSSAGRSTYQSSRKRNQEGQ